MKYSKETTIKLIQLEIEAKEKAVSLVNQIIAIVPKFNGKVANKRFDTALKAIDGNLKFCMEYNSFKISMYIEKRSILSSDGNVQAYINNHEVYLVHGSISSGYGESLIVNDGINGKELITQLENFKKDTESWCIVLRLQLDKLEKILGEYQEIKKQIHYFDETINYVIRDYFELKFK